MNITWVIPHHC